MRAEGGAVLCVQMEGSMNVGGQRGGVEWKSLAKALSLSSTVPSRCVGRESSQECDSWERQIDASIELTDGPHHHLTTNNFYLPFNSPLAKPLPPPLASFPPPASSPIFRVPRGKEKIICCTGIHSSRTASPLAPTSPLPLISFSNAASLCA